MSSLFVLGILFINLNNGAMLFRGIEMFDSFESCYEELNRLHEERKLPIEEGDLYGEALCVKMPGRRS